MFSSLLPYRQIDYQTDLTPDQIGQRLTENVSTGYSFYSLKPYYGSFTPYSFNVRKTSSRFKQQGISPGVDGRYTMSQGKLVVTLSLRPHTVWLILLCLFGFPCVFALILGVPAFLRTGDEEVLLNSLFPAMMVYSIFWVTFQVQSSTDIRFWEQTLQLQRCHI